MKQSLRMFYLVICTAVVCASDSLAQAEGRRLALVIGVSAYDPLSRLDQSLEDAREVGEVLDEKAGFEVTQIMDATSAALRRQVTDFAAKVEPSDVVVIYYGGHGVQYDGHNYLLPSDYPDDASQLTTLALSASELLETIGSKRPLIKLLILDACRNSPLSGVADPGLAEMKPDAFGTGTRIEFAASTGQTAADGLFAAHLVTELARPGLDVEDVFRNVRASVAKASSGMQTPMSATMLTVNFYFMPAQTTSPGDALANLERVSAAMPRGELGQTAALQALVQQQQSLAGTDLFEGLSLEAGTFNRVDLAGALLAGTNFSGSALRNANFTNANLSFGILSGADLSEATADSAAFAFAQADSATFTSARARGSKWFAARAHRAVFKGANLEGAGFAFADLRGAVFDGANLTGAVFLGSDLRGAVFDGAILDNTDFTGSRIDAGALTGAQSREACQLLSTVGGTVKVVGIEPIPSSRFSGGYEYSRFHDNRYIFRLAPNSFGGCEPRVLGDIGWFPVSHSGGEDHIRDDFGFRLSHKLLEQSGRRAEIRTRIAQHFEWLYPFPAGRYTATIAAADVPLEQRGLAGRWSIDFMDDGKLIFESGGEPPIEARYEKRTDYRFTITGETGPFQCGRAPAEYRWFLTAKGNLQVASYPLDGCAKRSIVLQAHDWMPKPAPQ